MGKNIQKKKQLSDSERAIVNDLLLTIENLKTSKSEIKSCQKILDRITKKGKLS